MSARKLGLNAVIYGLGGMLNRTISFLLLPLFTRYLTPEDYGRAGMLQILSVFLVAVFSAGIGGSLSSCYYQEASEHGRRQAVSSAVVLLLLSCGLLLAGSLPFAAGLSGWLLESQIWTGLTVLTLISTALSILVQPFAYSLQFAGRSRSFVSLSAISTLITALGNIATVVWLGMGLYGWVLSQMIGQGIALIIFAAPFFREGGLRARGDIVRTLLTMGLPMIPCFGCMYVIQQGNRYAVERFHGLEGLGIYSVALGLATVSSLAVSSFQTSWTPYFMSFRDRPGEAREAFGRMTTYYFYFMGLVTVCFFSFAQPVVEVMAGAEFHVAWRAVGLLAFANVLLGATNLLTPAQYFSGRLGHLTILQIIAAIFSVGVNVAMVSAGAGLAAASGALVITYALLLVVHYLWNRKGRSMELQVDYDWGRLAGVLCGIAIVAVFTLVFPSSSTAPGQLDLTEMSFKFVRSGAIVAVFMTWLWILMDSSTRRYCRGLLSRIRHPRTAAVPLDLPRPPFQP